MTEPPPPPYATAEAAARPVRRNVRPRKNVKKATAIIVAILCAFILVHIYRNYSPIDGVRGMIWGTFFPEDTVYAPNYTDSGFLQITQGMNLDTVIKILGPPINETTDAGITRGWWSKSPGDTHYRFRMISFSNSVVIAKKGEFYVD